MSKRDWFLFISTFVVAVLCGMWLYFTTFVPEYVANPVVQEISEQLAPEWVLTVQAYGGCERTLRCPGFSLTSRGQYRYQASPNETLQVGKIPKPLVRAYNTVLTTEQVSAWSRPTTKQYCESMIDGFDYSLQIEMQGDVYTLDTCQSAIAYDDPLIQLVDETFVYLHAPDQYQPSAPQVPYGGLDEYVEQRLDEIFDYDDR